MVANAAAVRSGCLRFLLHRYLLSIGVREQDLYGLDRPVQIGDVLVLPIDGFKYVRLAS